MVDVLAIGLGNLPQQSADGQPPANRMTEGPSKKRARGVGQWQGKYQEGNPGGKSGSALLPPGNGGCREQKTEDQAATIPEKYGGRSKVIGQKTQGRPGERRSEPWLRRRARGQ